MVRKKIRRTRIRYPYKRFPKKPLVPLIRKRIARDIVKTLRAWRISTSQRHKLLGLQASEYEKMKYGGIISVKKEILLKIIIIQKIDRALRSLLGKNPSVVSHWLNTSNNGDIFKGKKAIVFMCENSKNPSLVQQYLEYHAYSGW